MIRARAAAAALVCIVIGTGFVVGVFVIDWRLAVAVLLVTVLWALRVGAK